MTSTAQGIPSNTAPAIWTMTVFCAWPSGRPISSESLCVTCTLVRSASQVIPANIVME
ncbi:MAG: hypothetical protein V9E82_02900 [Candidatus Nanopelagicales bacterium]